MDKMRLTIVSVVGLLLAPAVGRADNAPPEGFVSLFNGKDLAGWKIPEGDGGHWKVVDGVIDYDAQSQAKGDKALWSEVEYRDFVLQIDWRLKEAPFINKNIPYILPDGTHAKDINGKELKTPAARMRIQVFICEATGSFKPTSGAGRSVQASYTAFGWIARARLSSVPQPLPSRRLTNLWVSGTTSRSRSPGKR